ncbi:hypothetical protein KAR91_72815 [Candidatus Pacearchaeota archaeon]|nr:hypothetical protein [Candidatus Pacearchaeota archaeon]
MKALKAIFKALKVIIQTICFVVLVGTGVLIATLFWMNDDYDQSVCDLKDPSHMEMAKQERVCP